MTPSLPALVAGALFSSLATSASAQWWLDVPRDGIPRTASGEPNLSAPTPRTADGHPNLSGTWEPVKTYSRDLAEDLVAPKEIPYQPWAKTLVADRADGSQARDDPPARCLPQGVPRLGGAPAPWKIVQTPGLTVILYEAFNLWRQVFTDGRRLAADVNPNWLGYSSGRWEGDTFVVETRGFNGLSWLDQIGKPSTEDLRVVERYRRPDFGHLEIEITIDDKGAYTAPWTVLQRAEILLDTDLLEFVCNENNRDLEHLPGSN